MATNKHAQLRYKVLDRCFRDFSRYYTIEDLLDEVNEDLDYMYGSSIKLRQLRQDIADMKGSKLFCAPIEYYKVYQDGKPLYYYRYADPQFSIFKTELNETEFRTLREALDMLGKFRGGPSNAWLEDVIANLECRFGVVGGSENLVSFEQNQQLKGREYLSAVIDATLNHRALAVAYRTYEDEVFDGVIHPYHVRQYNNRWFLFGLDDQTGYIVNRALDRITQIRETDMKFKPNVSYDFNHYFDQVIGVSVPYKEEAPPVEKIRLRFSKGRFPYVVSKPLHQSQTIEDPKQGILSIEVIPTRELFQLLHSFGPDIEVLSPESVKAEFREKIEKTYKKYFPVQNECTPKY